MPKTKTLGVRLTPDLIAEVERLKNLFGFSSYSEMVEVLVLLLQKIDKEVDGITLHPREWDKDDVDNYLPGRHSTLFSNEINELMWRRLGARFGEDGIQHIQELLKEVNGGRHG